MSLIEGTGHIHRIMSNTDEHSRSGRGQRNLRRRTVDRERYDLARAILRKIVGLEPHGVVAVGEALDATQYGIDPDLILRIQHLPDRRSRTARNGKRVLIEMHIVD